MMNQRNTDLQTCCNHSSKDSLIRVWSRRTLELYATLNGHDGPVNAVGLQGGKVVSASGDGNMILWDLAGREKVRVLQGHDRGLACVEFKVRSISAGLLSSHLQDLAASY